VAALLQAGDRFAGKRLAVVLCGANVDPDVLKSVL
jgi:threonine dehydratase